MLNLEPITIYHLTDEDTGAYERLEYQATVYKSRKLVADNGGFLENNSFKIRIPGKDTLPIAHGDYVFIGVGAKERDTSQCYKIVFIADNRRGGLPHYRIEAV